MSYRLFLVCCCFLLIYAPERIAAKGGVNMEIKAPQLKGLPLILCNYFEGTNYKLDSCIISSAGSGVIRRDKPLQEGLYLIYISPTKHFDLLLAGDQEFILTIDTANFLNNKIKGAAQSEAFLEYIGFLSDRQQEQAQLFDNLKQLRDNNENTQAVEAQLADLNATVAAFQQAFFQQYKNTWVGTFFESMTPVEGPFPRYQNPDERKMQFDFMKKHFFDHLNLQDPRFWHTNILPQRITTYMQQCVEFVPDSLANAAVRLVKKAEGDSTCFRLMLATLTNNSLQSSIMGMENIWAKLTEEYYLKKETIPGIDSTFLSNIRSEYAKVRFNRMGMTAQNILLTDTIGGQVWLYDACKKFTLLYFFEPSCGHCKEMTPLVHDSLFSTYKDLGLEVVCVYMATDKTEWQDFIRENRLTDWVNVWDPDRISHFWHYYDTSTTPAIFLLDENKKIIAKKLDVDSLSKLLERLVNGS